MIEAQAKKAGAKEAGGFRAFMQDARRVSQALRPTFIADSKTSPPGLVYRLLQRQGLDGLRGLAGINPSGTLWRQLGS